MCMCGLGPGVFHKVDSEKKKKNLKKSLFGQVYLWLMFDLSNQCKTLASSTERSESSTYQVYDMGVGSMVW